MQTTYLFRHAESDWNRNKKHLIGGRSNHTPLSPNGLQQAARLGEWIRVRGLVPDAIYASPAVRTMETGRIACETAGLRYTPVVDERLQELSQGIHEGAVRADVYNDETRALARAMKKDFKHQDGTSMNEAAADMLAWSIEARSIKQHKVIFAFGHGLAIRSHVGDLLDWDYDAVLSNELNNASVTIIDFYESGTLRDIHFNLDTQKQ